ncbi:phage tail tape measure protein [Zymobacter sp. IVIA_12111.31 C1]|uniref:phage tail tape measure protein n=1 Tax=Zymobacter sp. IVIA_12111.31 C1 TaxID=3394854 RepID=UPI0039C20399
MADASSEFNKMSLQFERTTKRLNDLQASAVQLGVMLASLDAAKAGAGGDDGEKKSAGGSGGDGDSKGGSGALGELKACKEKLDKLVQLAQKGADFDAKIALIGQSIPGFNEEMRQHLATLNRSLASDKNIVASGGDRDAILQAQQEAVQSHSLEGANADTLGAYTRNIGLYAAATGTSFKEADAVVRDLHDKLGIKSEEEFTRFGDRMTAVGSALEVRVSEIGGALATSGAWADKIGVSKEDSAALVATLLKGGMDQGEASSSFASMMKSFSTAGNLSAGDAKRLGFGSGAELYAAMQKDMMGTLNGLLDKLGDMDPAAQMKLATQLFGADGQKIVRALKTEEQDGQKTSLGDQLREARLKTHSEIDKDGKEKYPVAASDTMAGKAAAINDTAKVHFGQMNSEFERFSLLMSESLVPVTKAVVDDVTLLVRGLNNFLEAHPALMKGIGGIAATLMAGKAVAIGFKAAFSGLKFLASDVKNIFGGGSSGRSGNTALASNAKKAAGAVHKLALRIAELDSTASSADGFGGDSDFERSGKRGGRRGGRKGNRAVRQARAMLKRFGRTKFGGFLGRLGGSRIGKIALAGLGSELLSGDGLLHGVMSKGASLFKGGSGLMSKAAGIFSGGGGLVSKVMGSGALKGAGKLAGKLFKPLGLLQDGWNLAEGLANGDSHQVGKAAGSAAGGWGGGLAGAAAGAAIGSVVPVVGTAIGGIVGGVLGSLGGSAAGEWLGDKAAGVYDWFTGGSKDKKDGEQNEGWLSKAATIAKRASPLTMLLPSMDTMKSMGSKLADMGSSAWQSLREKGSSMLNSVTGAAKGMLNAVPFKAIGGKIAELGSSAWQTIRDQGSHLFSTAKGLLSKVPFDSIGQTLAGMGRRVWQSVREQGRTLVNSLKGAASNLLGIDSLKSLAGSLAERGREIWTHLREQGGQMLASLKEHALSLLPDSNTPKRLWDYFFGDDDSALKTKTMDASKTLPASRLDDPKSKADAVVNSTSSTNTTVTQNVNVTLHASGDAAQNQQLIDQLLQRLRSELAGGHPVASSPLDRRMNAGLTDAANG